MAWFGYIRVSTILQAVEGESIEAQAEIIRKFIRQQDPNCSISMHRDPGISGGVPIAERPGGKELCAALKTGDTLVTTRLDRLFRSTTDAISTTLGWHEKGVRIVVLSFGGGPLDSGTPHGRLMLTMMSAFSEFEREMIGERTRDAMKHIKASGKARSNMRPFGYILTTDRRMKKYEPEWVILSQMIRDRDNGITFEDIAKLLNKRKITTANGAVWDKSIVRRNIRLELERRSLSVSF